MGTRIGMKRVRWIVSVCTVFIVLAYFFAKWQNGIVEQSGVNQKARMEQEKQNEKRHQKHIKRQKEEIR